MVKVLTQKEPVRFLVLGGSGFIGSNFIHYLLRERPNLVEVMNYDALIYSGNQMNHEGLCARNYSFVHGDIRDAEKLKKVFLQFKPHYIINFAACSHVDRSLGEDKDPFVTTNTLGVFRLMEALRKYGKGMVHKVVQVSTDEVYGHLPLNSEERFTAKTPFAPRNLYAASKAGGDLIALSYARTWDLPVVVSHCTNNYGKYQLPEKFIPSMIVALLDSKKIQLYGTGENVRDWIWVEDHVAGILALLERGKPCREYLFGANNEMSNLEVAELVARIMGVDPRRVIEFVPDRVGHDLRYGVDIGETVAELRWHPTIGKKQFKQKLSEVISWYLNNPAWVEHAKELAQLKYQVTKGEHA